MTKKIQIHETVEDAKDDVKTFVHPCFFYFDTGVKISPCDLGTSIEQLGFLSFRDSIDLIHAGLVERRYDDKIIKIMKDALFWGFTGILYVPNDGAYVQDFPNVLDSRIQMDKSELVKRLEANDANVRFVPFGFKIGEMTSRELAKNEFVKALTGEEGAEKLTDIADTYSRKPYLGAFNRHEITRVPSLLSDYGKLRINCYRHDRNAYAFGKIKGNFCFELKERN